jgi:hypothetical protein
MIAQQDGHIPWLDFYPFETKIIAAHDQTDPNGVLLVDIGGSMGQGIHETITTIKTRQAAWFSKTSQAPSTRSRIP